MGNLRLFITICLLLLRVSILFKTHLFVRENVRLYNCCGLVSAVYFVFPLFIRKDYLGLYG